MGEKYEYHKQNDYPGERTAEKKRVSDREENAEKRADARVAEKGRTDELKADNRVARRGRMDDELMDSEIERSTARAERVNRSRNTADTIGIFIVAGIVVILLAGFSWSYAERQQQADEIDSLNLQIADSEDSELSNANKQIQLYKDFVVLSADVKQEVTDLENYNIRYSNMYQSSNMYQLCAGFMNRENNINLAMSRFAEKEIVYYTQLVVLADKSQCQSKIDKLNEAMVNSKTANEKLYVQNMNQCGRLMNNPIGDGVKLESDLKNALNDATAKANTFTNAENAVIACFA